VNYTCGGSATATRATPFKRQLEVRKNQVRVRKKRQLHELELSEMGGEREGGRDRNHFIEGEGVETGRYSLLQGKRIKSKVWLRSLRSNESSGKGGLFFNYEKKKTGLRPIPRRGARESVMGELCREEKKRLKYWKSEGGQTGCSVSKKGTWPTRGSYAAFPKGSILEGLHPSKKEYRSVDPTKGQRG